MTAALKLAASAFLVAAIVYGVHVWLDATLGSMPWGAL
jgi:F0F1-type ATP synthase assembly protein I